MKGGYNAEQRLQGFLQTIKFAGLSVAPGCALEVPHYSRQDGIDIMPRLIAMGVDGIFCAAGDNCAIGLLTTALDRGIQIPESIAIVGFDDLFVARLSAPQLTTIRQPLDRIAEAAHRLATTQRAQILRNPQRVIFKPELVVRQSA